MKIFLTGASGLVGSAFARAAARRGHAVVGVVGAFLGEIDGVAKKLRLDLTDEAATSAALLEEFPDAIVNAAALSTPEACDADPALAERLNVALPRTLAQLAHHLSARLVHLSSEQVFDGGRTARYAATDAPSPINLYGRQKVASEQAVHATAAEFAVTLRAPLLMGNSVAGRRSTHERLFADWAAGRTPKLFTDEFRQPCTAENLAEAMLELCERRDLCGVFHWAGAELVDRHTLGVRVREHFKLTEKEAPLAAVTRAAVPGASEKRQACLALDIAPLAGKLKTRPQTLAAQLAELRVPPPCRAWYFQAT
ncbi:MAG TPA: SDR family oxidoreductase [Opitutaceae bacterium]|nr:SDR family oxidoreductase [Opitutaceae bacterium]